MNLQPRNLKGLMTVLDFPRFLGKIGLGGGFPGTVGEIHDMFNC